MIKIPRKTRSDKLSDTEREIRRKKAVLKYCEKNRALFNQRAKDYYHKHKDDISRKRKEIYRLKKLTV